MRQTIVDRARKFEIEQEKIEDAVGLDVAVALAVHLEGARGAEHGRALDVGERRADVPRRRQENEVSGNSRSSRRKSRMRSGSMWPWRWRYISKAPEERSTAAHWMSASAVQTSLAAGRRMKYLEIRDRAGENRGCGRARCGRGAGGTSRRRPRSGARPRTGCRRAPCRRPSPPAGE